MATSVFVRVISRIPLKIYDGTSKKNSEAAIGSVYYKKAVPENFTKLTEKHMCWSIFFDKVAGQREHFQTTASGNLNLLDVDPQ